MPDRATSKERSKTSPDSIRITGTVCPGAKATPSRIHPRIALEQQEAVGRAPRTLEGAGEQAVDVGGSYRVLRNLNVTAGVRLSQERDRIAPLTDSEQDSQAVYVGTQFMF